MYLLLDKKEVVQTIKNFLVMVARQFKTRVQTVRSDNGTKFMGLRPYFAAQGILHQTSCVGTPQQNGQVERKHRHILNVARALRFQANLPIAFWGECVLTANFLINRTPSVLLNGKTPYEILYGMSPNYEYLRTFGCLCYARSLRRDNEKFGDRSRRCIFVGYPFGQKGWRVYDLESGEYFVLRDDVFSKTEFLYAAHNEAQIAVGSSQTEEVAIDDDLQDEGRRFRQTGGARAMSQLRRQKLLRRRKFWDFACGTPENHCTAGARSS